jgi:hypothetical protein
VAHSALVLFQALEYFLDEGVVGRLQIHFSEQDVIDACCVFVSKRYHVHLETVRVDLTHAYETGFEADAKAGWKTYHLSDQDLVDAIAVYLSDYHNFPPGDLQISLQFPEESRIEAYIIVS